MTVTEIFEKYLGFVWEMFMYDMDVLSQPWMYHWLLIPAVAYVVFMLLKWAVILAPLTLVWVKLWSPFMGKKGVLGTLIRTIKIRVKKKK